MVYGRETEEREREKTGRKRLTQEIIGTIWYLSKKLKPPPKAHGLASQWSK
jgi:hypothetical protein